MVKLVKIGEEAGIIGTSTTIENDGITVSQSGSDYARIAADTPFPSTSGKYVCEVTIINETPAPSNNIGVTFGIIDSALNPTKAVVCENYESQSSLFWYASQSQYGFTTGGFTTKEGDVVGAGWDLKNGKISFFVNGKLVFHTDIRYFDNLTGAAAIYPQAYFHSYHVSSVKAKINFGQQKYAYSYEGFMNLYDYKIGGNFKLKLY